jgi:hypothetical protein
MRRTHTEPFRFHPYSGTSPRVRERERERSPRSRSREVFFKFVACASCMRVRTAIYKLACGHVACHDCLHTSGLCGACPTPITRPPAPVDEITRTVQREFFGKSGAPTEAQLRADIMNEMQARSDEVRRIGDYGTLLENELTMLPEACMVTRCKCGLVCVRRTMSRSGKLFYGCPRFAGKGSGCGFFDWCVHGHSEHTSGLHLAQGQNVDGGAYREAPRAPLPVPFSVAHRLFGRKYINITSAAGGG